MPCYSPYVDKKENMQFPCGKCDYCIRRRISEWELRLTKENERSTSAYFVTLTYNSKYVPISDRGLKTLDKTDPQKFLKRLRKANKCKIKYYLVGEYGEKRMRPHYHIILFNLDETNEQDAWKKVTKHWQKGNVHLGKVERNSIRYTIGYVNKKRKIPLWEQDDRVKEYNTSSQRLGDNYLTPQIIKYHKEDLNRVYATLEGRKIPLPRYYKDKIYTPEERHLIQCEAKWQAEQMSDQQLVDEDNKRKARGINRKDRPQRL